MDQVFFLTLHLEVINWERWWEKLISMVTSMFSVSFYFYCTLYCSEQLFLPLFFMTQPTTAFRSLLALVSPEKWSPAMHSPLDLLPCFLRGSKAAYKLPFFWNGGTTLDLEDVFCSKTRIKILKLLFQYGQLNTSRIARRIGANYETALTNLRLLEKEDLVNHRLSGKARFFRLANSSKAKATIQLLQTWEHKKSNWWTSNSYESNKKASQNVFWRTWLDVKND